MVTLAYERLRAAADFRLTARQTRLGAGAVACAMLAVAVIQIVMSKAYVTPAGTPVGGDFAAFWTAAKALAAGDAAAIYDPAVFTQWLERIAPPSCPTVSATRCGAAAVSRSSPPRHGAPACAARRC